jgi:hypothetical protein
VPRRRCSANRRGVTELAGNREKQLIPFRAAPRSCRARSSMATVKSARFRVFLSPEPLMGRRFAVFFRFQRDTDHSHPQRDGGCEATADCCRNWGVTKQRSAPQSRLPTARPAWVERRQAHHSKKLCGSAALVRPERRDHLVGASPTRAMVGWPGSWQAARTGNRPGRSPVTKAALGGRANRRAVTCVKPEQASKGKSWTPPGQRTGKAVRFGEAADKCTWTGPSG